MTRPLSKQDGKEGVEAEYEQSPEFHELWKLKARDFLARTEWRKRKLVKRVRVSTDEGVERACRQERTRL